MTPPSFPELEQAMISSRVIAVFSLVAMLPSGCTVTRCGSSVPAEIGLSASAKVSTLEEAFKQIEASPPCRFADQEAQRVFGHNSKWKLSILAADLDSGYQDNRFESPIVHFLTPVRVLSLVSNGRVLLVVTNTKLSEYSYGAPVHIDGIVSELEMNADHDIDRMIAAAGELKEERAESSWDGTSLLVIQWYDGVNERRLRYVNPAIKSYRSSKDEPASTRLEALVRDVFDVQQRVIRSFLPRE